MSHWYPTDFVILDCAPVLEYSEDIPKLGWRVILAAGRHSADVLPTRALIPVRICRKHLGASSTALSHLLQRPSF